MAIYKEVKRFHLKLLLIAALCVFVVPVYSNVPCELDPDSPSCAGGDGSGDNGGGEPEPGGYPPQVPASISVPSIDSDGKFTISWEAPVNGWHVNEYVLEEEFNSGSWVERYRGLARSIAFTNPAKQDGVYRYRVMAGNEYGFSLYKTSADFPVVRPLSDISHVDVVGADDVPGKIIIIPYEDDLLIPIRAPVKDTDGVFSLHWDPLDGTVDKYEYRKKINGILVSDWVETINKQAWHPFNVCEPGKYQYEVRACNLQGCTTPAITHSFVVDIENSCGGNDPTPGPPKPKIDGDTSTRGQVDLDFSYIIDYIRIEKDNIIITENHQSLTYSKSMEYGEYTYKIQTYGTNENIETITSPWSDDFVVKVFPAPGMPTYITITGEPGNYDVEWGTAAGIIHRYQLQQRIKNANDEYVWTDIYSGMNTSVSNVGIVNGYEYFRVRACNRVSPGRDEDEKCSIYTTPPLPSENNLSGPAFSSGRFNLVWGGATHAVLQENGSRIDEVYSEDGDMPITLNRVPGVYGYRLKKCFLDDYPSPDECTTPYGNLVTVTVVDPPGKPNNVHIPGSNDIAFGAYSLRWEPPITGDQVHFYQWAESIDGGDYGDWNTEGNDIGQVLMTVFANGLYQYKIRACHNYSAEFTFCGPEENSPVVEVIVPPSLTHDAQTPYDIDGEYSVSWDPTGININEIDNFVVNRTHRFPGEETYGNETLITRRVNPVINEINMADGTWRYQLSIQGLGGGMFGSSAPIEIEVLHPPGMPTAEGNQNGDTIELEITKGTGYVDRYEWCQGSNCTDWQDNGNNGSVIVNAFDAGNDGPHNFRARVCNDAACSASVDVSINYSVAAIADAEWTGDTVTPSGDSNVGALQGQGGVSGGAATYSIPIAIPPGRNGMQPSLSINYSSRSGNGLLGQGWSLSAGGAIHRCASIYEIDENTRNVQLDNNDRLCLNGERLKVYTNNYGASGAKYHPETDPSTRVTQVGGDLSSSATYFKVEYANNHIEYYGKTTNAKVIRDGSPVSSRWLLEIREDHSGNQIDYHYSAFGDAGNRYLNRIDYTGFQDEAGNRHIDLEYEVRPDWSSDYLVGTHRRSTQRLKSIITRIDMQQISRYTLNYRETGDNSQLVNKLGEYIYGKPGDPSDPPPEDPPPANNARPGEKSLLKSIEQCNQDEQDQWHCLPVTQFELQQFSPDVRNNTEIHQYSDGNHYPVISIPATVDSLDYLSEFSMLTDMDGDGAMDMAVTDGQDGPFVKVWLSSKGGNSGFIDLDFGEGLEFHPLGNLDNASRQRNLTIDWNLDGRKDLVGSTKSGDEYRLAVVYWNPASNAFTLKQFNNIDTGCASKYWYRSRPGDTWFWNTAYRNCNSYAIDANGDGKQDLVIATREYIPESDTSFYTKVTWQLYMHCGDTVTPNYCASGDAIQVDANNSIQVSDYEGDGTPDLIGYFGGKGLTNVGSNYDFFKTTPVKINGVYELTLTQYGSLADWRSLPIMFDANADGLIDKLYKYDGSSTLAINTGDGFVEHNVNLPSTARENIFIEPGHYLSSYIKQFDYNRDGLTDLVIPASIEYPGVCTLSGDPDFPEYHPCIPTNQYQSWLDTGSIDGSGETFIYDFYDLYRWEIYEAYIDDNGKVNYEKVIDANINIIAPLADFNVMDYNLDGADDLVTRLGRSGDHAGFSMANYKSPGIYVYRNPNAQTDLLMSASDAVQKRVEFDYTALYQISDFSQAEDDRFYSVELSDDNSSEFPYQNFGTATQMVSHYRSSNGVGGLSSTRLLYRNAGYHLQGRGFQGFKTIIEINDTLDTRSETEYYQNFPQSGKVAKSESYAYNSAGQEQLVSETITSWLFTEPRNTYLVYADVSTSKTFDLESGSELYQTKVETTVDDYGNTTNKQERYEESGGFTQHHTETITSYDYAYMDDWWITKTDQQAVTRNAIVNIGGNYAPIHSQSNQTQSNKTSYLSWDDPKRLPVQIKTEAGLGAGRALGLNTTIETQYNTKGSPTSVTTKGTKFDGGLISRSVTTSYTDDEYFVNTQSNDLGHTLTFETDARFGKVTKTTDPNGVISIASYDSFGRLYSQKVPGSPITYTVYNWCNGINGGTNWCSSADDVVYRSFTIQKGKPRLFQYFDNLNRLRRTLKDKFEGGAQYYHQRVVYNAKGQKTLESEPYNDGIDPDFVYTRYESYDGLGRLTEKHSPQAHGQAMTTRYAYNGLTTNITAIGETTLYMSRTYNSLNQLVNTVDADGYSTRYAYNAAGQAISIQDASGNTIYSHYNALGHKEWVDDPNMGRKDFYYNSLGELERETDANGNEQLYTYDTLGRMTQRLTNGEITGIWEYDDNSASGGIGLLRFEASGNAVNFNRHEKTYHYTQSNTGRKVLYRTQHRIYDELNIQDFQIDRYTDSHYGRPTGVHYTDTGLSLSYHYNIQGYLTQTANANGHIYQNISDMNARGQITQRALNDGSLTQNIEYSPNTGQMLNTHVQGFPSSQSKHELNYQYDGFNNLDLQTVNTSNGNSHSESYDYDNLHRLTNSLRTLSNNTVSINYNYDELGNFALKDDYALSYQYGDSSRSARNAGPNAVYEIQNINNQTVTFDYDNNGNRTHTNGAQVLWYNAFNKPTQISQGGATSTFNYSTDLTRYRQQRSGGTNPGITYYVEELEFEHSSGSVKARHPIGDIAIETNIGGTAWERRYTHRDRLGSVVTVTDENDNIVEHRSYDPFGKPRVGDFHDPSVATIDAAINEDGYGDDGSDKPVTPRGFTDHEHLDDFQLIHMNGRVYDYNLGRFLSVDPYIQGVDSQAINPYSYIQNNPLSGTDPSGYQNKQDKEDSAKCDDKDECEKKEDDSEEEGDSVNDGNGQENQEQVDIYVKINGEWYKHIEDNKFMQITGLGESSGLNNNCVVPLACGDSDKSKDDEGGYDSEASFFGDLVYHANDNIMSISITGDLNIGAIKHLFLGEDSDLSKDLVVGYSISLAFQDHSHPGGGDIGLIFTRRAGGYEGFSTKLNVGLNFHKGSLVDQVGSQYEGTVFAGVGGVAMGFDGYIPKTVSINVGVGLAVEVMNTTSSVLSAKHGYIDSGCNAAVCPPK